MHIDALPEEDLEYRRALLRAAANGDVHAQKELEQEFHARAYSPSDLPRTPHNKADTPLDMKGRSSRVTWTTDKPTQPGRYRHRTPHTFVVVFYRIESALNGDKLVAMVEGSVDQIDLADLPGQWQGPILDRSVWE